MANDTTFGGTADTRPTAGSLQVPDVVVLFGFLALVFIVIGAVVIMRDRRKRMRHLDPYRPKPKRWWRRAR